MFQGWLPGLVPTGTFGTFCLGHLAAPAVVWGALSGALTERLLQKPYPAGTPPTLVRKWPVPMVCLLLLHIQKLII